MPRQMCRLGGMWSWHVFTQSRHIQLFTVRRGSLSLTTRRRAQAKHELKMCACAEGTRGGSMPWNVNNAMVLANHRPLRNTDLCSCKCILVMTIIQLLRDLLIHLKMLIANLRYCACFISSRMTDTETVVEQAWGLAKQWIIHWVTVNCVWMSACVFM